MTNTALRRLGTVFALLFAALVARQAYVQIVQGPAIAVRAANPRHALVTARRGRILAGDGTVLAQSVEI